MYSLQSQYHLILDNMKCFRLVMLWSGYSSQNKKIDSWLKPSTDNQILTYLSSSDFATLSANCSSSTNAMPLSLANFSSSFWPDLSWTF